MSRTAYQIEYQRMYREKNRERIRERYRAWNKMHQDVVKERDRKYRLEHVDELSKRSKQNRRDLKMQVMVMLGGPYCVRCGFSDIRALQIDHKEGGGNKDPVARKHGETYYRKILREGGVGLQVLCANCNWIKRFENEEQC